MKYLERLAIALFLIGPWCCGGPDPLASRPKDGMPSTEPGSLSCSLVNERLVCKWR